MLKVTHGGAEALVHASLSTREGDLRFLSIGGPAEAVKAILAALGSRQSVRLFRRETGGWVDAGWLVTGLVTYRTLTRKLPCGQIHGLLYPETALPGSRSPGFTLLLPDVQQAEAETRFASFLDMRTPLPLHPSWAPWLWTTFQAEGWLIPLEGEGPWVGWEVRWEEEPLTMLVTEAVQAGALRVEERRPASPTVRETTTLSRPRSRTDAKEGAHEPV